MCANHFFDTLFNSDMQIPQIMLLTFSGRENHPGLENNGFIKLYLFFSFLKK